MKQNVKYVAKNTGHSQVIKRNSARENVPINLFQKITEVVKAVQDGKEVRLVELVFSVKKTSTDFLLKLIKNHVNFVPGYAMTNGLKKVKEKKKTIHAGLMDEAISLIHQSLIANSKRKSKKEIATQSD